MRHVIRIGIVLAVLLAGIVLPGSAAQACTCAMPSTESPHQQYMKWADAVFTGEIVDKRRIKPVRVGPVGTVSQTYTIDVDTVFKGKVFDEQTLVAGQGAGSMCGTSFPSSGAVLIFGTEVRDKPLVGMHSHQLPIRYTTSLCSGSERLEPAQATDDLGEGFAPIGAEPATVTGPTIDTLGTEEGADWLLLVAIAGVIVAVVAGLAIGLRRRRLS
jgi:hypothetical protein